MLYRKHPVIDRPAESDACCATQRRGTDGAVHLGADCCW